MGPKKVSGMSLLRGSCYSSIKHHLLGQNTKEIKEDLIIFKLNIPNLHKAVIARTKSAENIQKSPCPATSYLLVILHNSFDAKIVWNWRLQILSPIRCTVALGISTSSQLKGFFYFQKGKVYYNTHADVVEVSALARLTFYENLLIGKEKSVRCTH